MLKKGRATLPIYVESILEAVYQDGMANRDREECVATYRDMIVYAVNEMLDNK